MLLFSHLSIFTRSYQKDQRLVVCLGSKDAFSLAPTRQESHWLLSFLAFGRLAIPLTTTVRFFLIFHFTFLTYLSYSVHLSMFPHPFTCIPSHETPRASQEPCPLDIATPCFRNSVDSSNQINYPFTAFPLSLSVQAQGLDLKRGAKQIPLFFR